MKNDKYLWTTVENYKSEV